MTTTLVANTPTFLRLAREADRTKRNRRVKVELLVDELDPEGIHLVCFSMVHNDREMRTLWMLKARDSMFPIEVFLDMSFEDYGKLTKLITPDGSEDGE